MTARPRDQHEAEMRSYAPNASLVPCDYEMSAQLTRLEEKFHSIVRRFFQNASPDQFNESFFDKVISSTEQEALADLRRQRADHVGAIIHLIERLWRGDKIKAEAKLAQNRDELLACERELARLEQVYHRGTSLAEDGPTA